MKTWEAIEHEHNRLMKEYGRLPRRMGLFIHPMRWAELRLGMDPYEAYYAEGGGYDEPTYRGLTVSVCKWIEEDPGFHLLPLPGPTI